MRKVLANTTPLIALANIGRLELLQKLYETIVVPQAVIDEIKLEPAKSVVAACNWIKIEKIGNPSAKNLFKAKLHAGEVEVMILAGEKDADLLIIDDYEAKKTAKFLGFNVTGTLGVLLKAKEKGYIERVSPIVDDLIRDGLYIDDNVKEYVLKEAGELE